MDASPTVAYWCEPQGIAETAVTVYKTTRIDPPPESLGPAEPWAGVQVDAEFAAIVPPPSPDEVAQLERLIRLHGCHDPLVIWQGTGILLDGYHRFDICRRHRLSFPMVEYPFADRTAARMYVLSKQGGRRNTSPEGASYLRGMRYLAERHGHGGQRASGQSEHLKTRQRLAAEFNVSASTIARCRACRRHRRHRRKLRRQGASVDPGPRHGTDAFCHPPRRQDGAPAATRGDGTIHGERHRAPGAPAGRGHDQPAARAARDGAAAVGKDRTRCDLGGSGRDR